MYDQVLRDNNLFLDQVATIPVNLEYAAWFAVIDPHTTAKNDPILLNEHLLRKPWFQRLESAGRNKCLLVTTRTNLPKVRAWIDENLEVMIQKSILEGINLPSSLLPRRLDKPVFTKTSQTYKDFLKSNSPSLQMQQWQPLPTIDPHAKDKRLSLITIQTDQRNRKTPRKYQSNQFPALVLQLPIRPQPQ